MLCLGVVGPSGAVTPSAHASADTRQIVLAHNQITGNGAWGVLVADLPDQQTPPTARNGENCQGGIYLVPPPPVTGQAPLCYFQVLGNQVLGGPDPGLVVQAECAAQPTMPDRVGCVGQPLVPSQEVKWAFEPPGSSRERKPR